MGNVTDCCGRSNLKHTEDFLVHQFSVKSTQISIVQGDLTLSKGNKLKPKNILIFPKNLEYKYFC